TLESEIPVFKTGISSRQWFALAGAVLLGGAAAAWGLVATAEDTTAPKTASPAPLEQDSPDEALPAHVEQPSTEVAEVAPAAVDSDPPPSHEDTGRVPTSANTSRAVSPAKPNVRSN